MSEQADQAVLDYLRRAADAAHGVLRSDQRLDFIRRLRGRIEEMRRAAGADDPRSVRKVLARFGDPAGLVERERDRLAAEAVEGKEQPAPARGDGEGPSTEPIPVVPPADAGREESRPRVAPAPGPTRPAAAARPSGKGRRERAAPAESGAGVGTADPAARPVTAPADAGGTGPSQDSGTRPVSRPSSSRSGGSTPQARPRFSGPPLYERPSSADVPADLPAAASGLTARLPAELQDLLRRGVIEALAIVVLGLGGLLRPIPVWFIGGVLVLISREWRPLDKLIGLLTPGVAVLVGAVVVGAPGGGLAGFGASILAHGWTYFKVGAVLGAMYLGWQTAVRGGILRTKPYWRYRPRPRR